jgi:CheY-like chemotaxis protein
METNVHNLIDILLVEDNPGDVRLTVEALKEAKLKNTLYVARDGEEALDFLYRQPPYESAPRPGLILLDLNLPKIDGREVLQQLKADPSLRRIPVVVLTTSTNEDDVSRVYDLNANSYVAKPVDLDRFLYVIQSIERFWLGVVMLPVDDDDDGGHAQEPER